MGHVPARAFVGVPLSNGQNAYVDFDDWPLVSAYKWHAQPHGKTCYAITSVPNGRGRQRTVRMHRLIMGSGAGQEVDHRNRYGLDNRRGNLRHATRSQQMLNQGVRRDSSTGVKYVQLMRNGRYRVMKGGRHLGCFGTLAEAEVRAACMERVGL